MQDINWLYPGHQSIKDFFGRIVSANKLAHAYLLAGPADIGKFNLAQDVAKYFYCEAENKPCRDCRSCRQIDSGVWLDYLGIDLLPDKKNISIEQITVSFI